MIYVLLGIAALVAGAFLLVRGVKTGTTTLPVPAGGVGGRLGRLGALGGAGSGATSLLLGAGLFAIGLFLLASTSFVFIDANRVGHLKRIYGFEELPPGRIVALSGQKGPQARILGPGFHLMPLVRVLYQIEETDIVKVPEGSYGELVAVDGKPMPDGMFIAPQIPDERLADMLNAETFLTAGGYRGPQETVLKPGEYRINRYLFDVHVSAETSATVIPAGHVGVVKSNVSKPGVSCVEEEVKAADAAHIEGALSVPLVPQGCVGIWREALLPGAYYLNRKAYDVSLVDTRVKTWEYKGGFTKRIIDLSVDQQGNIRQVERTEPQPVTKEAADKAVFVKVEGWDIPQELRVLVQVNPRNAPIVVGAVGGLEEIENRILTPVIRSIVRNVAGSEIEVPDPADPTKKIRRATRVLDLIENRDALEQNIEEIIRREGRKAGVDIQEIRLGEPAVPPELLISRLRQQLAEQLSKAYERETEAQAKRIETEQARSTANEQPRLVEAQIAVQVANQREAERAALGRAERQFLEELARGQRAQADVLGQDRVALLQALEKTLAALERKPELVALVSRLVPHTMVSGGGDGGLAGAAAILSGALDGSRNVPSAPPPAGPAKATP
ncbi:MAG: SPFH domain-containing protein [Hyphomicrobiaceae bacterium]|nr:SPFH domain-containing protein [Hyphomicrobiaceae bacterium]